MTIWPFDGAAPTAWLALYLATFALHVVFIGYVVAGTAYALVRRDAVAAQVRDRLPFMLGCAITAGVAPLLFLQLLYQRRFYTANLLLGPRWGAVVPALILGFYALYLAKAAARTWVQRLALGVGLACFAFVAWSWTEIHLVMQDEPAWRAMYAAGERLYADAGVAPRLALWLGAMATTFAALAAWWARGRDRAVLAVVALGGRLASGLAVLALARAGAAVIGPAHGWSYLMVAALVLEVAAWVWVWRAPDGRALHVVAGAGAIALVAGVVVREAPRLLLLEPVRATARDAGGGVVFALTAVAGAIAIAWIARTIRDRAA